MIRIDMIRQDTNHPKKSHRHPEVDFAPHERDLIARAAGNVAEIDSPAPGFAPTASISPLDRPTYPRERDSAPTAITGAHTPEAA